MKTKIALAIAVAFSFNQANAATAWYQPTPFPLRKSNGVAMPQSLVATHVVDGILGASGPLVRTDRVTIAATNRAYLNFDLAGLPANPTTVNLWLNALPSATMGFQFCIPNRPWDATLTWNSQPTVIGCTQYYNAPAASWSGWNITTWYANWRSGTWAANGIQVRPQATNNANTTVFAGSRYGSDGFRPILQFDFNPSFSVKMPLPAGYRWLLTNEIGGYECLGVDPWPDQSHQGNNYFALDFVPSNEKIGGGTSFSGAIPILAVAAGTVGSVGYADSTGYYVVINHAGGLLTRYIHFNSPAARKDGTKLRSGDAIAQGDQIGIMGNIGTGTGKHLHMNFWVDSAYNGAATLAPLTNLLMEGKLLKSYQTECNVNSSGVPTAWKRFYESSNTPTQK